MEWGRGRAKKDLIMHEADLIRLKLPSVAGVGERCQQDFPSTRAKPQAYGVGCAAKAAWLVPRQARQYPPWRARKREWPMFGHRLGRVEGSKLFPTIVLAGRGVENGAQKPCPHSAP